MIPKLYPFGVTKLVYEELAELPGRVKDDVDKNFDMTKLNDETLTDYLSELNTKGIAFENGLGKGGANDFTIKVVTKDRNRDKAHGVFLKALRLAEDSDDPAEVDAAVSLLNMLAPFGDVPNKNYEAQTAAMDSILANLAEAKYKAHVTKLGYAKYVNKIQTTNDDFKALFTTRVADELKQPALDLKVASIELRTIYNDTVEYILSMAKSKKNPNVELYKQLLTIVNAGRKYFQDKYVRRGK